MSNDLYNNVSESDMKTAMKVLGELYPKFMVMMVADSKIKGEEFYKKLDYGHESVQNFVKFLSQSVNVDK